MTSPRAVAEFLLPQFGNRPVEQFGVLLLDTKHRVLRASVLSIGTLDASIVHPREVFREAAAAGAAAIVLFHNHPSGDPEPSDDDVRLTERLMAAGVLDGHRRHRSRRARGREVRQLPRELQVLRLAKTLYFDCFSGVSGDMVVGGLLDLGLPLDDLRAALGTLPVEHAVARRPRPSCGRLRDEIHRDRRPPHSHDTCRTRTITRRTLTHTMTHSHCTSRTLMTTSHPRITR